MGRRLIRIGIVGCGLIGQKRARAAKPEHQPGNQIVAVADLDSDRARKLAAETGALAVADAAAVIAADLDLVIVATTHDQLSPIAIAAAEAGRHVLVEKPAGRNAAEVRAIAEAARRHGVQVKVGFNHRFHPALLKAREIVDSGVLGPLLYIRGRYGHGGRRGMEKEWRAIPELSGGGELIDQGSHLIDLSRWFLGDLKLGYAAVPTYFWDMKVDDNCFLALEAAGGQIAWLHATWTEWKNMFSFEISGRDGKLAIEGLGGSYGVERLTHYRMLPELGPPETTAWEYPFPDRSWDLEFADFARAIAENRAPAGNIDDALAMHLLIDQAYGR